MNFDLLSAKIIFLFVLSILFSRISSDQGQQVPVQQQPPPDNVNANIDANKPHSDSQRLAQKPDCRLDIDKYCKKNIAQLGPGEVLSDMDALECLQDAGYSENEVLQPQCAQAVWEYKVELTQDKRFIGALQQFCTVDINQNHRLKACTQDLRPGYALSCMMEHVHEIDQGSRCFQFLLRVEKVAFSDFALIAPFVEHCAAIIKQLGCGQLTKPNLHQNVRVPHSQGSTLECLISNIVNVQKDPTKEQIINGMSEECRKEEFCSEINAGEGKVFQCLMQHKEDKRMQPECARILAERAGMMGRDFRLAHPLLKQCDKELQAYRCIPQPGFEKSLQFHLSWVVLCLENGIHFYNQQEHERQQAAKDENAPKKQWPNLVVFSDECKHEMFSHREMMVQEFRMGPEVVMNCATEIDKYCSPKGDLETEGKTVHCLMAHAQERNEQKTLTQQCRNALQDLVKVADIGSNYQVDKVLYASCRELIEGKCKQDAVSEANTLTCLMKNLDEADMTDDCEQRLVEVQYFMARDWSLDPQLYEACHQEAVDRCSAVSEWHKGANQLSGQSNQVVDPGPQVLACLYRAGYDEEKPLKAECAQNVRRVLYERASRVNMLPDVEENCRQALSEYCSQNVQPTEEMDCLQEHFETEEFKRRHPKCYTEVEKFTKMESKDTKLNRLLSRACRPVINAYCSQYINQEIDHGDVLTCLSEHRDAEEMGPKCRTYVNHFELISLRDYHFNFRFTQACTDDIKANCAQFGQDKGAIIRCLSNIVFEHRILGIDKDLSKDCKKQLRVAYLQQEQVDFDDKEHMNDADPSLMGKCSTDIKRFQCMKEPNTRFEQIVECLRINFDQLVPDCKALIFAREKIEALDNTFDDELQRSCKFDINRHCPNQRGEKVLECLTNMKIIRLLQKDCQRVVQTRMLERTKDDRLNPELLDSCHEEAKQYEFDIQLDPQLYKACKYTISKHCTNTIIGRSGNFDSVLECLKSDFYNNMITDKNCAVQLARRTQESLVDIHLDPGLHEACSLDAQRICANVQPGESRIIMCLVDALRNPQSALSSVCREKLTERNKLWQIAHSEYQMKLPESWSDLANAIAQHPQRSSILTWFGVGLLILLLVGCCCGRLSKRTHQELKNR
uniref:Golgi apparatus protein 1 n=2 Tax=Meloidogyne incognita group TaxID=654580 RepID=A0A915LE40_MELJA